jgi:hypothetical protein
MLIGHNTFLSMGIALLYILSHRFGFVAGEETSVQFSFLKSSVATMKSLFSPWSLWSLKMSEQTKDVIEDERQIREPTKRPDIKVVFDSFYEEDYGIPDVYGEEQPSQQGIGRLSHQRKRDFCDLDDDNQNCGANRSRDRKVDSMW